MNIGLLEKEVSKHGINAVSKKYKLKKDKIKKLLGNKVENDKKNILEKNTLKNNIKDNISNKDIIKEVATDSITKDITNCNIDMDKLKLLVKNTEEILKIIEKEKLKKIKITDNRSSVTTIRINEQIYGMVKEYSKNNSVTITDVINCALVQYLESH